MNFAYINDEKKIGSYKNFFYSSIFLLEIFWYLFLACAPLLTINFERACMVRVETRIQSIYYIMLYSEGSGTRKVGFYGTYPGIKSKNGFAVYILNDDFCSRKEKRKISLFWRIWWLCKNMSKNLGKLKTQVLNTNSYCKRWWSIISVKYVVRISLQIFCLSCIFPPNVDQISTKKNWRSDWWANCLYLWSSTSCIHKKKRKFVSMVFMF